MFLVDLNETGRIIGTFLIRLFILGSIRIIFYMWHTEYLFTVIDIRLKLFHYILKDVKHNSRSLPIFMVYPANIARCVHAAQQGKPILLDHPSIICPRSGRPVLHKPGEAIQIQCVRDPR